MDWVGYKINIPDQHYLIITGLWKKDDPNSWWWKCGNCTNSSGVITSKELEQLYENGMVLEPDGETIPENSTHPKEGDDYSNYYYGWL